MGGYGSGRPAQWATVEGCSSLKLDVNTVMRLVRDTLRQLANGQRMTTSITWTWTTAGEHEPRAKARITLSMDQERGHAHFQYDVDHPSRRTGQQDQTVMMETTLCRYGGRRWWWVCPATGRRCATLYLPNGGTRFLSRGRGAYRLKYASQSENAMDRSHRRLARLHRKLGGVYDGIDCPLPSRPKWMRHATYERLVAEWEAQLDRHEDIWLMGAERFTARLQKLSARPSRRKSQLVDK